MAHDFENFVAFDFGREYTITGVRICGNGMECPCRLCGCFGETGESRPHVEFFPPCAREVLHDWGSGKEKKLACLVPPSSWLMLSARLVRSSPCCAVRSVRRPPMHLPEFSRHVLGSGMAGVSSLLPPPPSHTPTARLVSSSVFAHGQGLHAVRGARAGGPVDHDQGNFE